MKYRIANIFGMLTVAMALPLVLQAQGGGRGRPAAECQGSGAHRLNRLLGLYR